MRTESYCLASMVSPISRPRVARREGEHAHGPCVLTGSAAGTLSDRPWSWAGPGPIGQARGGTRTFLRMVFPSPTVQCMARVLIWPTGQERPKLSNPDHRAGLVRR
jgi:hypothetical protein